jgi:hypothetical protein
MAIRLKKHQSFNNEQAHKRRLWSRALVWAHVATFKMEEAWASGVTLGNTEKRHGQVERT